MTEGGGVILGPPEGQPGVLLGAGGPPEVRPHRVWVDVVDRPAVVGLARPHPEGVELARLAGAGLLRPELFPEDNPAGAGVDLDV